MPALHAKINLDRVGSFGFPFGGTCALRRSARHPAFHAGANEDGLFLGDEMPRGPFWFFDQQMPARGLTEHAPAEDAGQALTRRAEAPILKALEQPDRHRVILDGITHESFNDRIFLSRYPRVAGAGNRPAAESHGILSTRMAGFFSRHLSSEPHPLANPD